ncbi:MAG: hypothetical protein A3E31_08080 [Candidatus Rokubacteria bacterium RIFCSPHIGHO2_12_FULL_73_22]|nr:MAG: hypothetical protein A3D33_07480 [Candidatus Rokubacteria bacterium RIFCSPHIGHO2_02_FULL_73_26]OGK99083.1 MAG: hypothetical protein A3E31_08080 [Candidatus Rokubacteria bacterium RIFCSPHIGHO2_12_FULL_73_22]
MLPLEGIKVVEIAQNLAGPYAGEILAALGADVVKVERPEGGDDARGWGPPFWRGTSPAFLTMNSDKRSITLDLKDPAAVAWLTAYLGDADVLVQNLRPGVLEAFGLGPEALLAKYPRLVYCSLWAFGRTGPLRLRPGYEPMVQAFAGLMTVNGDEGGPPTRIGTSILDYGTGMWAAIGTLAALVRRQQTGRGGVVDASLFETALAWLTGHYTAYRITGELPVPHRSGSRRLVVFQAFEAKDGPVIVAAGNDRLFAKLAEALGRPDWAQDARFATNAARVTNRAALIPEIEAIVRTRTKAEWLERLEQAGVPCAPIQNLAEVLAEPQTGATGMLQPVPELGLELLGLPLSFDGERPPIRRRAPHLGEHNGEILGERG